MIFKFQAKKDKIFKGVGSETRLELGNFVCVFLVVAKSAEHIRLM